MERPKKVERKFSKPQLKLLEQAQKLHDIFEEDLALFTAKFPFMDTVYLDNFQTQINEADAEPDDESVVDNQQTFTNDLNNSMKNGRNGYTILLTYVSFAFPNNASVLEHFGQKRYRTARFVQLEMKELLQYAHEIANKPAYNNSLIAKGFLQTDIDNLLTLANAISSGNRAQENVINERVVITQERLSKLNLVYDTMAEISKGSKVVFINNYAKQQQYLLYSNTEQVLSNIEGPIAANTVLNLGLLPTSAKTFRFKNNGPSALQIGLSKDGVNFDGNTVTSGGVGTDDIDIDDLASTGTIVIVQNQSATQVGNYKLQILG